MIKRVLSLIVALSLLSTDARALQVVFGGDASSVKTTAQTRYGNPFGILNLGMGTSSSQGQTISVPGVFYNLTVTLVSAVGAGNSYTLTLQKNGVDTSLTCTISGASDTSCVDSTNRISVSAGDWITYKAVTTGTPSSTRWRAAMLFANVTKDRFVLPGFASGYTSGSTTYVSMSGAVISNATAGNRFFIMPTSGSFRNLYINLSAAPGTGNTVAFTLMKNNGATSVTCTVSGTSTSCSDTSNSVSYSVSDKLNLRIVASASATGAGAYAGLEFNPTNTGEFIVPFPSQSSMGSTTIYSAIYMDNGTFPAGETDTGTMGLQGGARLVLKNLNMLLDVAPGAGKSRVFTLRRNGAAPTGAITCTISNTATTCSDNTNSETVSDQDVFRWQMVPSGTPSSTGMHGSMVAYIEESTFDKRSKLQRMDHL